MRPDDDKNIFARTSVATHKERIADDDVVEDAFGHSHSPISVSTTSNNNATSGNMNTHSNTKMKEDMQLGDIRKVKE